MTTGAGFAIPEYQFLTSTGAPNSSGQIYVYQTGTTTPVTIYSDGGLTTPISNPLTLDTNGKGKFYVSGAVNLRIDSYTASAGFIETIDPVFTPGASATLPGNNTITNAILAQAPANTVKGNNTSGAANEVDLTMPQFLTMLTASSGALSGFRNAVMNGAFNVWQRGTSYALTTAIAYGSADRWGAFMPSSAAGIFSQSTSNLPTGFQFCVKMGRTAASVLTNNIACYQAIGTKNSIPLQGKQVTLSFYAAVGANYSGTTTFSAALFSGTGTDEALTNIGAWAGQATIISQSPTLTTTSTRFQYTGTLAATATELCVQFVYTPSGTAGADDNVYITGVQLELGTSATPFENRPIATEIELCKWYYEKSFLYATAPAQNVASTVGATAYYLPTGASGTFGCSVPMTPKRIAPTITTYNPSASNANWRDTTNSADRTVAVGDVGDNSFQLSGASGAAASVNRIHWAATAEL